jgi:hypothetical protein
MSSDFRQKDFESFSGLIQVTTLPGGSRTHLAFECLSHALQVDPPASSLSPYFIFISDEGVLYPPALNLFSIPLSRFLMVKTPDSPSAWNTALEALQTGLFAFIFLRPSKLCHSSQLRRMQLLSEKLKAKVFLLSAEKLPHWTIKGRLIAKP